jgi:ATP-dependent RNA helicase DHX37/DHR1
MFSYFYTASQRRIDRSGIQTFEVSWISKASSAQRAGRAGRTGPGHCYRLYSSSLFETHFNQFSVPEILRTPIDGLVLQMKSMGIETVVNFPYPTPPERDALQKSERSLTYLGALNHNGHISELGVAMSHFPLSPRFSRMLVGGRQHDCLPYVIAIVATLSVGDPFLAEESIGVQSSDDEDGGERPSISEEKEVRRERRKSYFQSQLVGTSCDWYDLFVNPSYRCMVPWATEAATSSSGCP